MKRPTWQLLVENKIRFNRCPQYRKSNRLQHRELHGLLFSNSVQDLQRPKRCCETVTRHFCLTVSCFWPNGLFEDKQSGHAQLPQFGRTDASHVRSGWSGHPVLTNCKRPISHWKNFEIGEVGQMQGYHDTVKKWKNINTNISWCALFMQFALSVW